MSYRVLCVNNAVKSIHKAKELIAEGKTLSATIMLDSALRSLHNGLDIGPSEQALDEFAAAQKDAA